MISKATSRACILLEGLKLLLASSHAFHIMRDHPDHGTTMLGGGWGYRATPSFRAQWKRVWGKALKDRLAWSSRTEWGVDQSLLRR